MPASFYSFSDLDSWYFKIRPLNCPSSAVSSFIGMIRPVLAVLAVLVQCSIEVVTRLDVHDDDVHDYC